MDRYARDNERNTNPKTSADVELTVYNAGPFEQPVYTDD
jgi:hypothetical protein